MSHIQTEPAIRSSYTVLYLCNGFHHVGACAHVSFSPFHTIPLWYDVYNELETCTARYPPSNMMCNGVSCLQVTPVITTVNVCLAVLIAAS